MYGLLLERERGGCNVTNLDHNISLMLPQIATRKTDQRRGVAKACCRNKHVRGSSTETMQDQQFRSIPGSLFNKKLTGTLVWCWTKYVLTHG